ncbi:helix-turn-helix domain-containing protein [Leuconostoc lactis]|uniref:helix-turn-helix domain-containing protein n=1 Tax=Leuconostoc lactis TaxID=1246 RepID=UPI001645B020|nr:helix-turn-helix transcriptional regulator [Leuconostoc lactis]
MYKVINNELAQKILIKRRQQSITLSEMAEQVNVTRATISQIERLEKQVVQERVFSALVNWLQEGKK